MARINYVSLNLAIRLLGSGYVVELHHRDPLSQAELAPVVGSVTFDLERLR